MKKILFLIPVLVLFNCHSSKEAKNSVTDDNYIFFLHNKFLEDNPDGSFSAEYSVKGEYREILQSLRNDGFVVLSEKRKPNTNWIDYAEKTKSHIDSLLSKGVKANHITIVGTSKGGYIALYVSTIAKNQDLNFVFIGSYQNSDIEEIPEIEFCRNILTIYEKSDIYGVSAIKRKQLSKLPVPHFKEVELNTGLKHGFLYTASDDWLKPCKMWAKRNYELKKESKIN
jgi:hypothetical protein